MSNNELAIPKGFVGIPEVMRRRGVSYAVVYRRVKNNQVRSLQLADRSIVIDRRDVSKIDKHEPPPDRKRIPIQLVPNRRRYAAWSRAAAEAGVAVSKLAGILMDERSGYKSGDE